MPLLTVTTNVDVPTEDRPAMLSWLSGVVSEMLEKPENYVMVSYQFNPDMSFAGTTESLAFLELKSLELPDNQTTTFSAKLCNLISSSMQIPEDRIYIEFTSPARHMWGWNNITFG